MKVNSSYESTVRMAWIGLLGEATIMFVGMLGINIFLAWVFSKGLVGRWCLFVVTPFTFFLLYVLLLYVHDFLSRKKTPSKKIKRQSGSKTPPKVHKSVKYHPHNLPPSLFSM